MFIAIISSNTDADRSIFDEVHAVRGVTLADDQLPFDEGAGEERISEVSSLVGLLMTNLYMYLC